MFKRWIAPVVVAGALVASALTASAASLPAASPDVTNTATAPAAGTAMLQVVTNANVGTIITDGSSRTLYLRLTDERNLSKCAGQCAQIWPPLLSDTTVTVDSGLDQKRVGSTKRDDGSTQVTYNGWPLYYFSGDKALSDTKGEGLAGVWFVVSPYGGPRATPATVKVTNGILTDGSGRTLYAFSKDSAGVSNCSGACASFWPPALTVGIAKAGSGATGTMINMINREEGSSQVTYNGMPLYYFSLDTKPGDTNGEGVIGSWFAVSGAGEFLKTLPASAAAPATTAPAAPASLPHTGEDLTALMAAAAAAGASLLAAAMWLRRATNFV